MNEVRPTQVTGMPAGSSASLNKPSDVSKASSAAKAEAEKPSEAQEALAEAAAKPVKVKEVVASMNEYIQSIERDLQFSVDEETDKTVIKVLDGGSGELIRQIPEETFLELARKLNEDGSFQLIDALG